MSTTPDHADILKRLERLERQRLALLFVSVLALAAAGTCLYKVWNGGPSPDAETVNTARVVFRDTADRPKGLIRLDDSGEGLVFCDANGGKIASVGANQAGTRALHLFDANGTARISLASATDKNKPAVTIYNPQNKASVGLDEDGLKLFEMKGEGLLRAWFIRGDSVASFGMCDLFKPRISIMVNDLGPRFMITAEDGTPVFGKP